VWWTVPLVLLAMLAVGAAFVRLPYYAIAPGSARQVDDLIDVQGAKVYPPQGKVLLTTVSLGQVRNVYDAIEGWADPSVDVVPENQILPKGTNDRQYQQLNVQAMTDSKDIAEYVAFRTLGYQVAVHGQGALIVDVRQGFPAASAFTPGDLVVAVDGKPVALSDDAVAAIQVHKPGQAIRLTVKRADSSAAPHDVQLTLADNPDSPGKPFLGVSLQTFRQSFDFPFRVNIDSGQIGGPSAGLAFTLGLLDVLTPGELTGGVAVAATGTIAPDGSVGPVGGVAQKTVAVKRAGATLFLVPSDEYAVAKARAGTGLRVERADTLEQALRVLATLRGSNALALGQPGRTS
jgi:Lon-like protease